MAQKQRKLIFRIILIAFSLIIGLLTGGCETSPHQFDPSVEQTGSGEEGVCTISISCATVIEHMELLPEEKRELIPENGVILAPVEVSFSAGMSAFDLLRQVCRENGIHLEFSNTPMYRSAYIEGINNLYEFDAGERSGWMFQVNGRFPNYGSSRYYLSDGDEILWVYTCDLGEDVGGGAAL